MKKFFEEHPKIKDTLIRALKTFWQAALAYIIITIEPMIQNIEQFGSGEALKNLLVSLALGAISAGFSALYNGLLKPLAVSIKADEKKDAEKIEEHKEEQK